MTHMPLRALFDAALELPPGERDAYLRRACSDDTVRGRVQLMLDWATHATGDVLPMAQLDELAAAIGEDAPKTPPPGTRIGPFELLEPIGEGGYATVFHAFREQNGVRQDVALKLLRGGLYTAQAQRQFRRERQALAQLQHPNIASLVEGGVTDTGLAYIALQLVHGVPITQFVRERRLDLDARLRLILQVCRAVETAHRALIVHRDLKPSNVLVTDDGRVMLLDFGVAKLLESDDATQTRAPGFTPAYAAPEQHRNDPITTATDVYALGVLLGELATGQRLNDGSGRTPSAQISQTTEPGVLPAPPRVTQRLLRGDLDNILLKAIEPEPTRRYPTAGALADDIERHLAGRPVSAHPPSRLYRARKFVTRHKGGVASTVAFTLAVFAALGLALWQARIARDEAARANEQTHRAEAVRDFLVSVFDAAGADQPPESRPTLEQLVDDATARALADTRLHAATRADLLGTLGGVSERLGAHTQALSAIDAALPLVPSDDRIALALQVARAETLISLARQPEAVQALEPHRAAFAARNDMLGNDGLRTLATALAAAGAVEPVRQVYAQARTQAATLPPPLDAESALRVDMAESASLVYLQRFADGLALADAAWQRWQTSGGGSPLHALDLLKTISSAAGVTGDTARADQAYRDAIALSERHYVRPHPQTAWVIGLYGSFLVSQGRFDEATPFLTRALDMRRALLGEAHPDTLNAIAALGRQSAGQQRADDAVRWFEQGIALCRKHAVQHNVCPRLLGSHAQMLAQLGRLDDAVAEAEAAVAAQAALTGAQSPPVASMLGFLARTQVKLARYDAVLATTDRIAAIYATSGGGPGKDEVTAWTQRALALFALKRNDEALALVTRALERHRREFPDDRLALFWQLVLQARALSRAGQTDAAAVAAREALAIDVARPALPPEQQIGLERIAKGGPGY